MTTGRDTYLATSRVLLLAGSLIACLTTLQALAGDADAPANVVIGREIMKENGCNGACHAKVVGGGDPFTLYTRSIRRVNSLEELRRQVESCVSSLSLPIFPDDVSHVVTALDHDAYHFD
jgi:hypothetical protein